MILAADSTSLALRSFIFFSAMSRSWVRLIVRDLKIFSRLNEEVHSSIDLREVLDTALRLAKNEIRHRIRSAASTASRRNRPISASWTDSL